MFSNCQSESELNLAYLEALIALNEGIDVDDVLELDKMLKTKCLRQYDAVNREYDKRRDELLDDELLTGC